MVNLEDKSLLASLNEHPKNVFALLSQNPKKIIDGKADKRIFLMVDEVQYLDDPSNFLKYLYDEYEYNLKVVATGSSAFYIDKKFRDSLHGNQLSINDYITNTIDYGAYTEQYDWLKEEDKLSSWNDFSILVASLTRYINDLETGTHKIRSKRDYQNFFPNLFE